MALDLPTTTRASHKIQCTQEEFHQAACLNGGECFGVPGGNGYNEIGCKCPTDWTGTRCEQVALGPIYVRVSSMVIGIVAAVVILVLFSIILIVYCVRRRRKHRQSVGDPEKRNGHKTSVAGANGRVLRSEDNTEALLCDNHDSPTHTSGV